MKGIFALLSVLFVLLQLAPRWIKRRLTPAVEMTALGVFLALYLIASLILFNAAHNGGRLVHQFGVHALV